MATKGIDIPKSGEWPGTFESYRLVKDFVKVNIWHFVSVIGIWIIISWVIAILLNSVVKNVIASDLIDEIFSLAIGAFIQSCFIFMYFNSLKDKHFELKDVMDYGFRTLPKMFVLIFVMDILLIVSFILLVIPFLIILPRVYLAPYFLVQDNLSASEALGFSWNLTKGHSKEVYGIIGLDLLIALLFLTIIGIPFAIYFLIINSGSFAYLTMYISQPKVKAGSKKVKKSATKLQLA